MSSKCEICREALTKYKCSTCFLPYCSVNCWKSHQHTGCQRPEKEQKMSSKSNLREERFATEDSVPQDKLINLGESELLRTLLKNPHLQKILHTVDSADDAANIIHQAMLEPIFVEFADECLRVVEDSQR